MQRPEHERPVIRVAAAVIVDDAGRLLLVRKRGTTMFMQPGGKLEPGETPAVALARELEEEIGARLDPQEFDYLGRYDSDAANESGHGLDAEMFRVQVREPVAAASEIEELVWIHPRDVAGLPIAPLVLDHVVAILRGSADD